MSNTNTLCHDCGSRPRSGAGRWLCSPCEDAEFGIVAVHPAQGPDQTMQALCIFPKAHAADESAADESEAA